MSVSMVILLVSPIALSEASSCVEESSMFAMGSISVEESMSKVVGVFSLEVVVNSGRTSGTPGREPRKHIF